MQNLCDKQTMFFGKVTAGMTHEINNVLAIIRESSGLMEDIAAVAPVVSDKYKDKFFNAMSTIKQQIKRGIEITSNLNRFAHVPDNEVATVDLNEAAAQTVTLTSRLGRLKNISIQGVVPDASSDIAIELETNPTLLMMALFTAVECGMDFLPNGGTIMIEPLNQSGEIVVVISASGDSPASQPSSEKLSDLDETMKILNGSVSTDNAQHKLTLNFS